MNGSDGNSPHCSLTPDGAGNYYGTASLGGPWDDGSVFELSPNGSGGWDYTLVYSFTGGPGGAVPYGNLVIDGAGNIYGTTLNNGAGDGFGNVYELSPTGTGWTETVLYSFTGFADANPQSGLIRDAAGNLYGTTLGDNSIGEVFELSPSGGGWTETVIYNSGAGDYGSLTMDGLGNIFGTTYNTVFELSPNGDGGWTPTVLYSFKDTKDGAYAQGMLALDGAGNLYGTTVYGGSHGKEGDGTVYRLSAGAKGKKKGAWTKKILHSFKGGKNDGEFPYAGVVLDGSGNVYGVTESGGKYDDGTVFELVPQVGKASYKEEILWNFNGPDGAYPYGGLIMDGTGNLYGTTFGGGPSGICTYGCGVVFEITR